MKIRKPYLSLRSGNKGLVFTTDVVFALTIVIIMLTIANFYVSRAGVDNFAELQIRRTGSDMVTLLDNQDLLNPPLFGWIRADFLLPDYYGMRMIGTGNSVNCDFEVGDALPVDKDIFTGRRFFVISGTDDYCLITHKIWQK